MFTGVEICSSQCVGRCSSGLVCTSERPNQMSTPHNTMATKLQQRHVSILASQIIGNRTVCPTACSKWQQRKHQNCVLPVTGNRCQPQLGLLPWCPIYEGNPPLTGHITTLVPYLWGEPTTDRAHYYPGALFVRGIHHWPGTLLPWCPICEGNPPLTGHITTLVPYLWGESTSDRAHHYPGALFVRGIHLWPGTLLPWCPICEGNPPLTGHITTLVPYLWGESTSDRAHYYPGALFVRGIHHWPGTLLPWCPICEGNPPLTGHITTLVPYLWGESTSDRAHYYRGALFVRGIHHCRAHYYPGALFVRGIHHWPGTLLPWCPICEGNPPLTGHITTLVLYLWGEPPLSGHITTLVPYLWEEPPLSGHITTPVPYLWEEPPLTGHITTPVPYLWEEPPLTGHITTPVPYLWGESTIDGAKGQ